MHESGCLGGAEPSRDRLQLDANLTSEGGTCPQSSPSRLCYPSSLTSPHTTTSPPSFLPHTTTMPHICGPHTNLPNCRHNDTRRFEQPGTTWVPIPIHKVQEMGNGPSTNLYNVPFFAPSYALFYAPPSFAPSSNQGLLRECHPSTRVNNIPIQLAAPGLIMKAKEAGKDDLFPRKKKSEFY